MQNSVSFFPLLCFEQFFHPAAHTADFVSSREAKSEEEWVGLGLAWFFQKAGLNPSSFIENEQKRTTCTEHNSISSQDCRAMADKIVECEEVPTFQPKPQFVQCGLVQ